MLNETTREYSLPGVLHYLQSEWRRFERERNEWAIERAELKARIALLEGERRGSENLRLDLVKRVKMLEYALKQERKKHLASSKPRQALDDGGETDSPNNVPSSPRNDESEVRPTTATEIETSINNADKSRERSRQILKSCLQEINHLTSLPTKFPLMYTIASENIRNEGSSPSIPIDSQSSPETTSSPSLISKKAANKTQPSARGIKISSGGTLRASAQGPSTSNPFYTAPHERRPDDTAASSSAAVAAQPPPPPGQPPSPPPPPAVDEDTMSVPANVDEVAMLNNANDEGQKKRKNGATVSDPPDEEVTEDMSREVQEKYNLSTGKAQRMFKHPKEKARSVSPEPQDDNLGNLDPSQINDLNTESAKSSQEQQTTKVWKARVTVKGHLDSVRSVAFHPKEMMVASGSDDGTVKVWSLRRCFGKDGTVWKRGGHDEAEPIITYRGHTNIVTCVAISAEQNRVYSAGLDASIRVWRLPGEGHELFSPVDPSLSMTTYVGHTDAVWDFKLFPVSSEDSCFLASASADGTVKIWDTQASGQLLKSTLNYNGVSNSFTYGREQDLPVPTSVDFCHTDLNKLAVSYSNAEIRIFDIETGQVVTTLKDPDSSYDGTPATQINKLVAHPTMPLVISGHEDRFIKFFDLKSGKCAFSMSAHLDAVSCLDIDPSGTALVSGGHDSSIRLWDISMSKTCMQEFSAHRRKGHEGVLSVQYHKLFPWMVSGGADSIVKVYHHAHH